MPKDLEKPTLTPLEVLVSYIRGEMDWKGKRHDLKTIIARTRAEGLGFLTRTLPTFGDAILSRLEGHEIGKVPITSRFLSGLNLDDPHSFRIALQVCFMFKKHEADPTEAMKIKSIQGLKDIQDAPAPRKLARLLSVFKIYEGDINHISPYYSAGSTLKGKASAKYDHEVIDVPSYPNIVEACEGTMDPIGSDDGFPGWSSRIAKKPNKKCGLLAVPKDTKKARLVTLHDPANVPFTNGLARMLKLIVGRKENIRFTDQSVNASLALKASEDKSLSTIDLSSASDYMSWMHFKSLPSWLKFLLFSFRESSVVEVDKNKKETGRFEFKLKRTFAGQGNGMTFPLLSSLCYYCCHVACTENGVTNNYLLDQCHVYGDDIIAPTEIYSKLTQALEDHGLVVNKKKSFVNSFFRESCGIWAYKGHDVTPVMLRSCSFFSNPQGLSDQISALQNPRLTRLFYKRFRSFLRPGHPGCGFAWSPLAALKARMNPDLQTLEGYVFSSVSRTMYTKDTKCSWRAKMRLHFFGQSCSEEKPVPAGSGWNLRLLPIC